MLGRSVSGAQARFPGCRSGAGAGSYRDGPAEDILKMKAGQLRSQRSEAGADGRSGGQRRGAEAERRYLKFECGNPVAVALGQQRAGRNPGDVESDRVP